MKHFFFCHQPITDGGRALIIKQVNEVVSALFTSSHHFLIVRAAFTVWLSACSLLTADLL